jgi:hypothetical protein
VAQHLLGIGTAVLAYLLARRLLPERMRAATLIAGLVLAVLPYPIVIEQTILSESLFTFLLMTAAYSLLMWSQEDRARYAICCGALLALAALTRPIALGIAPLWMGLLLLLRWKADRKRAMGFVLYAGLAWIIVLLPLLIRNYSVMGSFAIERSLGRNLISVADRWISYGVVGEQAAYPRIMGVYGSYLHQKRGPDAVVVYAAMPELRRATGWSDIEIDRALEAIAWEGIRAHPREFLVTRLRRLPLLLRDPGPSSWYALHEETYLPLLARTGRINPELVSRSIAWPGLDRARFELASSVFEALSVGVPSGGWMIFSVLGFAGLVFVERNKLAWFLAGMLAYLWIATILVQPANARYRIPGLAFETLFTVAGFWFAAQATARVFRTFSGAMTCMRGVPGPSNAFGLKVSANTILLLTSGTLLAILVTRAWLTYDSQPLLGTADFVARGSSRDPAAEPGFSPPQLLRDLPVAGRSLNVLYWEGSLRDNAASVSAETSLTDGGFHAARLFYSCEVATCAGATLRLTAIDGQGQTVAETSSSLSQERTDNDLFWDQLELRIAVPSASRRLRAELSFQAGMGNVVIPLISIRPRKRL